MMSKSHCAFWPLQSKNFSVRSGFVLGLLLITFQCGLAQQQEYIFASENVTLRFEVTHLGVLKVRGSFESVEGMLVVESEELKSMKGRITAGSIQTKNSKRDEILKSEAYLDVDKYPYINFQSALIAGENASSLVTGALTIKETTRSMRIPMLWELSESEIVLKFETVVDRKDFNLDFGTMDTLIGEKIDVKFEIRVPRN